MKLVLDVNTKHVNKSLQRLQALTGRPMQEETRRSGRRVAVSLARMTGPRGTTDAVFKKAKNSVARDVRRSFRPLSSVFSELEPEQKKQLGHMLRNSTPAKITKILQSFGIEQKFRKTAPRSIHQSNRIGFRVPKLHKAEYTVADSRIDRLIDIIGKRIGTAKNGWAMAARDLGGTRGISAKWIIRKRGKAKTGSGKMIRTSRGAVAQIDNYVPYVSNAAKESMINSALKGEGKVLQTEIQRAYKRAVRKR